MNTNWKIQTITLAALLTLTTANAQKTESKDKDKKKSQSITIVRTGDSDEKITVEVTGDKVTVNGKPLEDYKGEDIRVITAESDIYHTVPGRALATLKGMRAPMAIADFDGDRFVSWGENKAKLGVSTEDGDGGAKITEVTKESAAEKAGLKSGDVITKVNEFNVADADDLPMAINKFKPEDKVTITYKRDGVAATTTATLEKNKHVGTTYAIGGHDFNFDYGNGTKSFYSRKPRLGVQIEDLQEGNGVKVLDVNDETPAGKAGLQKDDVITSFDGKEIKGVDDIRAAMKDVEEGETVKVSFKRGSATQNIEIKFPKAVKKASL